MVSKTGAERQKEYYDNNGQAVKLSKLRFSVKTCRKRESDPAFDEDYRKKEAERKRQYRARKTAENRENASAAAAEASDAADDVASENDPLVQESKKSRQALVGMLQRKKTKTTPSTV